MQKIISTVIGYSLGSDTGYTGLSQVDSKVSEGCILMDCYAENVFFDSSFKMKKLFVQKKYVLNLLFLLRLQFLRRMVRKVNKACVFLVLGGGNLDLID